MVKRLYFLTLLACLSAAAGAVTKTAVFDFSSPEALAQLGLPTPTSSTPTYLQNNITVGDITFIPGSSSPRSTYYQSQYTFYTTSGNTFSFQAASGATIKRVDFDGFYAQQRFTASPAHPRLHGHGMLRLREHYQGHLHRHWRQLPVLDDSYL